MQMEWGFTANFPRRYLKTTFLDRPPVDYELVVLTVLLFLIYLALHGWVNKETIS